MIRTLEVILLVLYTSYYLFMYSLLSNIFSTTNTWQLVHFFDFLKMLTMLNSNLFAVKMLCKYSAYIYIISKVIHGISYLNYLNVSNDLILSSIYSTISILFGCYSIQDMYNTLSNNAKHCNMFSVQNMWSECSRK